MSEKYELTTIQDIFEKVPTERIQACCQRIGEALASAADVRDLAALHGIGSCSISFPMTWEDDGRDTSGAVIEIKERLAADAGVQDAHPERDQTRH